MSDIPRKLAQGQDLSAKVTRLLQRRLKVAQERFLSRVEAAQVKKIDLPVAKARREQGARALG